jgi:HD domain
LVSTERRRGGTVIGMSAVNTTIAGIRIPDGAIAAEATEFVRDVATPLLFDHSRRVFLWGALHGEQMRLDYDAELFYVAAMFHDMGLVEGHRSEHERFEIDGANAARSFLERHGVPEDRVTTAWDAIALHTTAQIPRYKGPEATLVNWGVEYDIPGRHFDRLTAEQRDAVIAAHPRAGFKAGIIEALGEGIRDKPETAFAKFQVDILERTMPGYVRHNFCDEVQRSRFAT